MKKGSNAKKNPQPVRFEGPEEDLIRDVAEQTGFSLSTVIRKACSYAVPKFLSGEINILNLKRGKR